ncbi:hypothetical protein F5Y09DRAFT_355912 [Xylaria sp. FL1042]|nr:hypothetical protein F5Y09DRAFT_355912 [Xylaria sp. FL1042]
MILPSIKQAFGRNMIKKKDLSKLAEMLHSTFDCVSHFEALEEKRGYNYAKQFPADLYKGGIQKLLLDHWLSRENGPNIYTLNAKCYNLDAGIAGQEWAAFLRVRNPNAAILRVYPKDRTAKAEHILCQLLSSLIYNFTPLVPEKFDKVPGLYKRNFQILAQGGPEGIDAGLRILESLPPLKLRGGGIMCVVDALNLAGAKNTIDAVEKLTAVLGRILARHNGHLLFTLAKQKKSYT